MDESPTFLLIAFCSPTEEGKLRIRGATVAATRDIATTIRIAQALGPFPGSEVLWKEVNSDLFAKIPSRLTNRVLSEEECEELSEVLEGSSNE